MSNIVASQALAANPNLVAFLNPNSPGGFSSDGGAQFDPDQSGLIHRSQFESPSLYIAADAIMPQYNQGKNKLSQKERNPGEIVAKGAFCAEFTIVASVVLMWLAFSLRKDRGRPTQFYYNGKSNSENMRATIKDIEKYRDDVLHAHQLRQSVEQPKLPMAKK